MGSDIQLIQLVTPEIDGFARFSVGSWLHYARQQGLGYTVLRSSLLPEMHINWTKIAYLQQTLASSDCGAVLLVDADTLTGDPDRCLNTLLASHPGAAVFMARDTALHRLNKPNAGFILVRNTARGREIINLWLAAARGSGRHDADRHPRNQRVYWKYVMPSCRKAQALLGWNWAQKWQAPWLRRLLPTPFLFHFSGTNSERRTHEMERVFRDRAAPPEILDEVDGLLQKRSGILTMEGGGD